MSTLKTQQNKLKELLSRVYKKHSAKELNELLSKLMQILESHSKEIDNKDLAVKSTWNESSGVLITYPDAVLREGEASLKTLAEVLDPHIGDLASIIHLLPFLCSTSDGGFAISSHKKVAPKLGDWVDIKQLAEKRLIMADLVLNHVSASHKWVREFIQCKEPGKSFIFSISSKDNWNNVFRPRSTSLFKDLATKNGIKSVWTTFGPDQIDINWKNPLIVLQFFSLIIRYLNSGIRWFRLDAVGFIWKEKGTNCIHLEEAHYIVKIIRLCLNRLTPSSIIITETNVPEKENISYLESGDEANLAYNFALPPLLLEALISNNSDLFNKWLTKWPTLPKKTGYLNFTASHDGIGLTALKGLMDQERLNTFLVNCEQRGGLISHRSLPNGIDSPYEINISWWSAMGEEGEKESVFQKEKFLLTQLLIMSLKGVPAFYLQALMASGNDIRSFKKSGQRRDLNREKFDADALIKVLNNSNSLISKNLKILRHAMYIRSQLEAFHPDSPMQCLSKGSNELVVIKRGKEENSVWAIYNMTNNDKVYNLTSFLSDQDIKLPISLVDYLTKETISQLIIRLKPYSIHWLGNQV